MRGHARQHVPLPAIVLHELARQLDCVAFDALQSGYARDVDAGEQLMQAVPEFVEKRRHFTMREIRGPAVDGPGEIAGEPGDGVLQPILHAPPIDCIVHPGAALLALARIQIEVELADERTLRIADLEEAHARMPGRCAGRAYGDAVDRLDDSEQAGE